jgi:small subunit ribosomal protein S20
MPLTKSAKKALKVAIRRKGENDLVRAKVKGAVKGARLSVAKKEQVGEKLQKLYRELDIAAKKHVIHKNKAARLKSRITKQAQKEKLDTTIATPKKVTKKTTKK